MIVHYKDENGNELASCIVLSGYIGDDHITGAKDLADKSHNLSSNSKRTNVLDKTGENKEKISW